MWHAQAEYFDPARHIDAHFAAREAATHGVNVDGGECGPADFERRWRCAAMYAPRAELKLSGLKDVAPWCRHIDCRVPADFWAGAPTATRSFTLLSERPCHRSHVIGARRRDRDGGLGAESCDVVPVASARVRRCLAGSKIAFVGSSRTRYLYIDFARP